MTWRIHHKAETASTNLDAREGVHGDVFTADYQTAGRGRLDHKWLSPKGANLMMSVVLSVEGLEPEQVATLPLVVGLAVAKVVNGQDACSTREGLNGQDARSTREGLNGQDARSTSGAAGDVERASRPFAMLKWPNDVLVNGKKIAGILCERHGDNVIAGIGVNVGQTEFDTEIADRATSLALNGQDARSTESVRDAILCELDRWYALWRAGGFAAVHPEIAAVDLLRGRTVSVRQADDDSSPVTGVSNGIMNDGSLDVGGTMVYAGEAHVENF